MFLIDSLQFVNVVKVGSKHKFEINSKYIAQFVRNRWFCLRLNFKRKPRDKGGKKIASPRNNTSSFHFSIQKS
jgi:hypothetical protein